MASSYTIADQLRHLSCRRAVSGGIERSKAVEVIIYQMFEQRDKLQSFWKAVHYIGNLQWKRFAISIAPSLRQKRDSGKFILTPPYEQRLTGIPACYRPQSPNEWAVDSERVLQFVSSSYCTSNTQDISRTIRRLDAVALCSSILFPEDSMC